MSENSASHIKWLEGLQLTVEEARDKCRNDLYWLATEVLEHDLYYEGLHRPLFEDFMGAPDLSLFLIPRDHLKTTSFTICGSIWAMLCDPNIAILITSSKLSNSLLFSDQIKRFLQLDNRLTFLFPEYQMGLAGKAAGRREEWSIPCRTKHVAKEYSVTCGGVDASMVSRHFHIIFVDDLVTDQNIRTPEAIEQVASHWNHLWPMLWPGTGMMVVIGTRWDPDDLYNTIIVRLKDEGALIRIRSALEKNAAGQWVPIYPHTSKVGPDGRPVVRYNKEILRKLRKRMGDAAFFAQFMNKPVPDAESRIVAPEQILWVDRIPENVYNFVFIDPAISMRDSACDTAIVCVARDHNDNFFLRDVVSNRMLPSETARFINEFYQLYQPKVIAMETVAWQTVFKEHVEYIQRTEMGMMVPMAEMDRYNDESKLRRILGLQPLFQEKRFFLLRNGRGIDKAKDQLLRFSKTMIKRMKVDIVDAMADSRLHTWPPPRPVAQGDVSYLRHLRMTRRANSAGNISSYTLAAGGRF